MTAALAALGALGSGAKHLHAVQNCLEMALPKLFSQQSPPSYSHPALLLPSSQLPSPLYCSNSHADSAALVVLGALGSGSKHSHAVQNCVEMALPKLFSQQSPPH